MKAEAVAVAALSICVFLSFYFAFLSFQETDDAIKKQLVTFAASSIIAGVVMMACLIVYVGIKRAFLNIADQFRRIREPRKTDDS